MLVFNRMCVVCLLMLLFKMRRVATMAWRGEVCLVVQKPRTVSNEPDFETVQRLQPPLCGLQLHAAGPLRLPRGAQCQRHRPINDLRPRNSVVFQKQVWRGIGLKRN